MAKISISTLFLVICILGVVHAYNEKLELNDQKVSNYWCVAKEGAPDDKLQEIIDSLCATEDCSAIQPGGSCFDPNTVYAHASYALNLNFINDPRCNWQYGTVTSVDPCKIFIIYA
ncbi:hypothetical protein C2S51_002631 [Perilla frutescens var. frutescens]|nr:hypothetical protein C2S51_002631 [Perilla frutescens var. frutescens]